MACPGTIRLGLCCKFEEEPISFRMATAAGLARLGALAARARLSDVCLHNALALEKAILFCAANGIGAFRVNSQILPLKTHSDAGYDIAALDGAAEIAGQFRRCGRIARERNIRLLFHPDQFIVINSPDPGIVRRSVADLEYHAEVAGLIGADVVNLHAGGVYGDKAAALARLRRSIGRLPAGIRRLLTLENDDRCFTPADLIPVCLDTGVPLVYDVHHHRCLPDGVSIERTTRLAIATWNREPVFHVSSPRNGWGGPAPAYHHDYINARDFPACWLGQRVTVEVEAKAKEKAVLRLRRWIGRRWREETIDMQNA
ncbi:MAG: UV DNA damage repair endonuclease UvsE [bacterium]